MTAAAVVGEEIGLGVVGLGMGSLAFAAHAMPQSTMRVRAVCDTDASRLESVASQYGVPFSTPSLDALLARDDVDVVAIYTPDPLHVDHVLAALEAGKHVICTKPMVTRLSDAVRVLAAVRRTGLQFLVGQTCRFNPSYIAAHALASQGAYGRLLFVEASYNHDLRDTFEATPWRCRMPQDFLYGALCHPMDLAMWIGGRVARVSAFGAESRLDDRYPPGVLDNYVVSLEFESGALGRVIGMYNFVHPSGMPYIDLTVSGTVAGSYQGTLTLEPRPGERTVEPIENHLPAGDRLEFDSDGHHPEVARYLLHFEDCLRRGVEPSPSALEATRVIAALDAVRESVASGRAVEVAWDF